MSTILAAISRLRLVLCDTLEAPTVGILNIVVLEAGLRDYRFVLFLHEDEGLEPVHGLNDAEVAHQPMPVFLYVEVTFVLQMELKFVLEGATLGAIECLQPFPLSVRCLVLQVPRLPVFYYVEEELEVDGLVDAHLLVLVAPVVGVDYVEQHWWIQVWLQQVFQVLLLRILLQQLVGKPEQMSEVDLVCYELNLLHDIRIDLMQELLKLRTELAL